MAKAPTKTLLSTEYNTSVDFHEEKSHREYIAAKIRREYQNVKVVHSFLTRQEEGMEPKQPVQTKFVEDVDCSHKCQAADPTSHALRMNPVRSSK
jgi:hypothetical protein